MVDKAGLKLFWLKQVHEGFKKKTNDIPKCNHYDVLYNVRVQKTVSLLYTQKKDKKVTKSYSKYIEAIH